MKEKRGGIQPDTWGFLGEGGLGKSRGEQGCVSVQGSPVSSMPVKFLVLSCAEASRDVEALGFAERGSTQPVHSQQRPA